MNFKAEDTYPDCLVYDQYDLLQIRTNGADYNVQTLLAANKAHANKSSLEKILLAARFAKRAGKVLKFGMKPGDIVELRLDLFEPADKATDGRLAKIQVVDTIGDYANPLFLVHSIQVLKAAEMVKPANLWNGKNYSNVIVGKSGYIFYASDRFLEIAATDPAVLKTNLTNGTEGQKISQLRDWLKQRGVELIVMIVPIRANILTNEFPAHLRSPRAGGRTYGSVYNDYFQQLGISTIFAPQVFEVPDKSKVCYKTGTHWNYYGAYLYYLELMKRLAPKHPELTPVPYQDLVLPARRSAGDNVLARLECIDDLGQDNDQPSCLASSQPDDVAKRPSKPSILMVHDSFFDYIKPFMASSFANFNDIYIKQNFIINESLIQKYQPNYFVILYCERYLDSIATFKLQ